MTMSKSFWMSATVLSWMINNREDFEGVTIDHRGW